MSINKQSKNQSPFNPNDHLANERTYLAWVRTGIAIMAFGFVLVKFSLFVKQIGFMFQTNVDAPSHGYSAAIGIFLVILGALSILFSFLQYQKTRKQLMTGNYQSTTVFISVLTGVIFFISILLIAGLLESA